jgi:CYTH domain-containing protein
MSTDNINITCIAIDGGPCSGKSRGLVRISQELVRAGIIPVVVPEAATALISSGVTARNLTGLEFQRHIARLQISNEETWMAVAQALAKKHKKRVVLLCDRGLLGAAAYLSGNAPLLALNEILAELGLNIESARIRYAGVIHMVTAAEGAEEFYTLSNNDARKETLEEARILDKRTMKAWLGHPHLAVVRNVDRFGFRISFKEKMDKVVSEVFRILGHPVPLEIEDKYRLESFDPSRIPVACESVQIIQTYLVSTESNTSERVRMRAWLRQASYFHTIKKPGPGKARIEIERLITVEEYNRLLLRSDSQKCSITKTRHCFVWRGQYFEVDVFEGKLKGLVLMERERTDENDLTEVPCFIRGVEDVTNDAKYSNSTLAEKV